MSTDSFDRRKYYSITELCRPLDASFKTIQKRVDNGDIVPDYISPITKRRYFEKQKIKKIKSK